MCSQQCPVFKVDNQLYVQKSLMFILLSEDEKFTCNDDL